MGGHPTTGLAAVGRFQRLKGWAESPPRFAASIEEADETVDLYRRIAIEIAKPAFTYVDAKIA